MMNEKSLITLEYFKIKQQARQYLVTDLGQRELADLRPMITSSEIRQALNETKDAVDILRLKGGIPLPQIEDVKPFLKRLDIGATLNAKELAAVGKILRATNEVRRFFRGMQDDELDLSELYEVAFALETLPDVAKRLTISIENDGHVTDDASGLLKSIRRQIATTEQSIRDTLANFTRGKSAKYLSEAVVTIRQDKYVLPVKAEYRHVFGGRVYDQSTTGQTLFIEPKQVVALNDRLAQQENAQNDEIRRILQELSELIAPYTGEIEANAKVLGHLDLVNAKAAYAKKLKATEPVLTDDQTLYLRQAWHPLLDPKKAVKNDIMLGKDFKTMLITGPNTGGKTITLKTIGLIQLMGQSGFFIPANEESRICVFDEIFADIGDEQSIEQNLSTFSAHMTNIVSFLEQLTPRSLVLFDELGSGTDPQEGAALAIAILDDVAARGSYVVATTHYPELKVYGYERPETVNASVEFDSETLKPTYKLLIGIPGRSNALDISRRLGLPTTIIDSATQLVSKDSQELNNMIGDLVQKRHDAEEEKIQTHKYLVEAEQLHADLEKAYTALNQQRDNLLEKAKKQANEMVEQTKHKADQVITDLRQMRLAGGTNVKENRLIDAKGQLNQLHQPENLRKNKVLKRAKKQHDLQPNDDVLVKTYGQKGVLLQKVGNHDWEVQIGILKMKINENDLEKIKITEENAPKARTSVKRTASSGISTSLDLRGQRYEEALTNVDRYLDSAQLAGYSSVTLIHGKGTGSLRQGITKYLKNNRAVKSFEYASPNNGGDGATIVYLK